MPSIIKQGQLRPDDWNLLRQDENGQLPETAAGGNVIVPLADWLERRAFWRSHAARVGVWLSPDDDPARLLADLPELELIAVDFPAFTDGRGYSHARLLRERYAYRGNCGRSEMSGKTCCIPWRKSDLMLLPSRKARRWNLRWMVLILLAKTIRPPC